MLASEEARREESLGAWISTPRARASSIAVGTADQFIRTGAVKTALVIGADVLSAFTNWEDRGSCILFGDGAGAVVIERTKRR